MGNRDRGTVIGGNAPIVDHTADAQIAAELMGHQTIEPSADDAARTDATLPADGVEPIPSTVYGECSVTRAERGNVIERFGTKMTPTIEVIVPIIAAGMTIHAAVFRKLTTSKDGSEDKIEPFIMVGSSKSPSVKFTDEISRENFDDHVYAACLAWPGLERTLADADDRLMNGSAIKRKADGTVRPTLAPRLVKRIVSVAPASGPAAVAPITR